jgi:hypothetical protein
VRQQAREIVPAERREQFRLVAGDEQVLARFRSSTDWCRCQPLAKVLGNRGRHMKLDEIAVPPRHLLHGAAEQHHGVGGGKTALRREGELVLARAQFDFERDERHAERLHRLAQDSRIGST